uniref:EF-hand domain-containing protein n=1 Tax=Chromera velia CCMP2878 TaxID=1169474 RepID=A0A0G4FTN5_9ALVE|eukprot:Cvel_18718.t1-p1 / transcript=Cvel_18718.t1 / gene=Cvel_18718 / organism=Chromera_velia_CCMP2878 / gene_product=hypothetical protein / transcript_product=hypothetical protein / location=Cvel_scaffold1569:1557-12728(+) / protein_length=1035 / sequence_SO=supercontig / SO=protein_coding / is_pseudo=false
MGNSAEPATGKATKSSFIAAEEGRLLKIRSVRQEAKQKIDSLLNDNDLFRDECEFSFSCGMHDAKGRLLESDFLRITTAFVSELGCITDEAQTEISDLFQDAVEEGGAISEKRFQKFVRDLLRTIQNEHQSSLMQVDVLLSDLEAHKNGDRSHGAVLPGGQPEEEEEGEGEEDDFEGEGQGGEGGVGVWGGPLPGMSGKEYGFLLLKVDRVEGLPREVFKLGGEMEGILKEAMAQESANLETPSRLETSVFVAVRGIIGHPILQYGEAAHRLASNLADITAQDAHVETKDVPLEGPEEHVPIQDTLRMALPDAMRPRGGSEHASHHKIHLSLCVAMKREPAAMDEVVVSALKGAEEEGGHLRRHRNSYIRIIGAVAVPLEDVVNVLPQNKELCLAIQAPKNSTPSAVAVASAVRVYLSFRFLDPEKMRSELKAIAELHHGIGMAEQAAKLQKEEERVIDEMGKEEFEAAQAEEERRRKEAEEEGIEWIKWEDFVADSERQAKRRGLREHAVWRQCFDDANLGGSGVFGMIPGRRGKPERVRVFVGGVLDFPPGTGKQLFMSVYVGVPRKDGNFRIVSSSFARTSLKSREDAQDGLLLWNEELVVNLCGLPEETGSWDEQYDRKKTLVIPWNAEWAEGDSMHQQLLASMDTTEEDVEVDAQRVLVFEVCEAAKADGIAYPCGRYVEPGPLAVLLQTPGFGGLGMTRGLPLQGVPHGPLQERVSEAVLHVNVRVCGGGQDVEQEEGDGGKENTQKQQQAAPVLSPQEFVIREMARKRDHERAVAASVGVGLFASVEEAHTIQREMQGGVYASSPGALRGPGSAGSPRSPQWNPFESIAGSASFDYAGGLMGVPEAPAIDVTGVETRSGIPGLGTALEAEGYIVRKDDPTTHEAALEVMKENGLPVVTYRPPPEGASGGRGLVPSNQRLALDGAEKTLYVLDDEGDDWWRSVRDLGFWNSKVDEKISRFALKDLVSVECQRDSVWLRNRFEGLAPRARDFAALVFPQGVCLLQFSSPLVKTAAVTVLESLSDCEVHRN